MYNTEVFENEPEGFNPKIYVAASYVNVDGKVLLMQLSQLKNESGSWGVPAGKIEANEPLIEGACRELFEETGIRVNSETPIKHLAQIYIRKPDTDYVYHIFSLNLKAIPDIQLSEEHTSYRWVTHSEAKTLKLMYGAEEALEIYRKLNIGI